MTRGVHRSWHGRRSPHGRGGQSRRGVRPGRCPRLSDDTGSIVPLLVGLAGIATTMILLAVTVTAAHLGRMQLLDAADGAALDAADALATSVYASGVGRDVPLTDAGVRAAADAYLARRPRPSGIEAWQLEPGTGSPDGRTAQVAVSGQVRLPVFGSLLGDHPPTLTVHVTSSARAGVQDGPG